MSLGKCLDVLLVHRALVVATHLCWGWLPSVVLAKPRWLDMILFSLLYNYYVFAKIYLFDSNRIQYGAFLAFSWGLPKKVSRVSNWIVIFSICGEGYKVISILKIFNNLHWYINIAHILSTDKSWQLCFASNLGTTFWYLQKVQFLISWSKFPIWWISFIISQCATFLPDSKLVSIFHKV